MNMRGPAKRGLFSSWSRITWQTVWHRKHSMHLWNSCTRPRPREADGTYRMQQRDIDRVQEFRKCIECFLCQTVCHVIRDHEENKPRFAGPRMFIRYAELEMHPLDTNDRRDLL